MGVKKTTEQFIKEAKEVHGDRYDYSLVEYVNNKTPVTIICKEHGEGTVRAIEHLKGANCYKCGKESMASKCRKTKEEFIEKSIKKHGNKYNYDLVEYKNNRTFVKIICKKHGVYEKTPDKHINGSGCKKCLDESNTKTTEKFIEECKIKHNNFYSYEKTEYIHSRNKVTITCPIHGDFEQQAGGHFAGYGCKECKLENNYFLKEDYIKLSENAFIYLILCKKEEESFYKIGKTINSIKKRFSSKRTMPYEYSLIHTIELASGEIYDLENKLHKKYRKYKYKPTEWFAGYTECYSLDLPIQEILDLECQKE